MSEAQVEYDRYARGNSEEAFRTVHYAILLAMVVLGAVIGLVHLIF